MPKLGDVGGRYPAGSTTEQQQFADALCQVYRRLVRATLEVNGRRLFSTAPALSGYFNAKHIPASRLVRRLYAEAARDSSGEEMPFTLSDLLHFHEQASVRLCDRCRGVPGPPECGRCKRALPAAGGQQGGPPKPRKHRWSRQAARPREAVALSLEDPSRPTVSSGLLAPVVLPVPPEGGDRQNYGSPALAWAGLEDAIRHLNHGRNRDAHLVLTQAGGKLPVHNIPDLVTACHGAGLEVAADAVLHSAARRQQSDVLRIVRMFNDAKQYAASDLLLQVATAE
ncbi:hypothetical protein GCM10009760_21500 [Kitasatospora kazusensis]|uniref:Uncharacterized protein n=1 Tax=Kitasatospora kazusensis TaxID=407974 RepID=A0ABN2ZAS9_9ACTN